MKRRVVVTGIGIITAHGLGRETNWTKSISGESSIHEITSFDSSKYKAKYGGEVRNFSAATLDKLHYKRLDRASHLLIHTTREALSDAQIIERTGDVPVLVSIGTTGCIYCNNDSFRPNYCT